MLSKFRLLFVAFVASGLLFCLGNVSSAYDEPPARVIVQVIALGSKVPGSEVSVGDSTETTGINGSYVFSVDKGAYTVTCTGAHGGSGSKDIRVKPGEIIQVTFELGAVGRPASVKH